MKRRHIVWAVLVVCSIVTAQDIDQSLKDAREETQKRVAQDAAEQLDPQVLKPYELRTEEKVTHDPETGKVTFIDVKAYRGGTLIERHTRRSTKRTGELDNLLQFFLVDGKIVASVIRFKGTATTIGNSLGVTGQNGIDVTFSDDNKDGKFESLLFMDITGVEPRIIEAYKMGDDEFYIPLSAEDYYRTTRHLHAVAPVMSAITNIIESPKDKLAKGSPNEQVHGTADRRP